jgi:hypothetical protein
VHLEPELLGDQEQNDFLCHSRGAEPVIASDHCHLYAVHVETVLALPRYQARTGRRVEG